MGTMKILDKNCKHVWISKEYKNPITKKKIASWDICKKCGSERKRRVYN